MRKLIARYVIRRTWNYLKDRDLPYLSTSYESPTDHYEQLCEYCKSKQRREGLIFNFLGLITSALGGHFGWFPYDVQEDFGQRAARRVKNCEIDVSYEGIK